MGDDDGSDSATSATPIKMRPGARRGHQRGRWDRRSPTATEFCNTNFDPNGEAVCARKAIEGGLRRGGRILNLLPQHLPPARAGRNRLHRRHRHQPAELTSEVSFPLAGAIPGWFQGTAALAVQEGGRNVSIVTSPVGSAEFAGEQMAAGLRAAGIEPVRTVSAPVGRPDMSAVATEAGEADTGEQGEAARSDGGRKPVRVLQVVTTNDLGPALGARLGELWGEPVEIVGLHQLTAGASRQTWSVSARTGDGHTRTLVLLCDIRQSQARDVGVEAAALRAAAAAGVPVPALHDVGDGSGTLARNYLLMEHVDGKTIARRLLREDGFAAAREVLAGSSARPQHGSTAPTSAVSGVCSTTIRWNGCTPGTPNTRHRPPRCRSACAGSGRTASR